MVSIEGNLDDDELANAQIKSVRINVTLTYLIFKKAVIIDETVDGFCGFCSIGVIDELYERIFVTLREQQLIALLIFAMFIEEIGVVDFFVAYIS